ncbi:hypothetical protein [Dokdonia sp.]|uniref:hypothetical protein n=1 Tax=Dokdonia sp. TaxID=2024995 RepID=UPI0032679F19
MNRKSLFLSFIFLVVMCCPIMLGQQAASAIDAITPTTPEAGTLSRAGNVPINPATGQMSYSVPIHVIQTGGSSWPISLQYNYGGFIAEAKPSLSGWGWNLNAYGSITKVTRGLPDFHPDGYYGEHNRKQIIDQYVATNNIEGMPFEYFWKFVNNEYDSEADKYIVNVGGANFSFKVYIDQNDGQYKAHFLSNHNFKVAITMQSSPVEIGSFQVTDGHGTIYYFNSEHREYVVDPQDSGHPYNIDKTTSWLLSKVEYINGQDIQFNYTPDDYTSWDFSAFAFTWDGATGADPNQVGTFLDDYIGNYNDRMNSTDMQRQILTSITFPKGSLHFETATGPSGHKVFDAITLKDHTTAVVNTFEIDYQGARDALTEVRKNNELLFGFDYLGLTNGNIPGFYESPTNKPLNQDIYGFYNGSNNNQEAIDYAFNEQVDKSIKFGETRKGAMSKIIYPTGGHTSIEYEQNTVKTPLLESDGSGSNGGFNRQLFLELNPSADNDERHIEVTHTFDFPVFASMSHSIVGDVASGNAIHMEVLRIGGDDVSEYFNCYPGTVAFHPWFPFTAEGERNRMLPPNPSIPRICDQFYPNPPLTPFLLIGMEPGNGCPDWNVDGPTNDWFGCTSRYTINQQGNSGTFWLLPGTYRFLISTRANGNADSESGNTVGVFSEGSLQAHIRLQYQIPPNVNEDDDPENSFVNDLTGGIRVNRISNHDKGGDKKTEIIYDYNDEQGLSTAEENQIPNNVESHQINLTLNNGAYYERTDTYYKLNSFGAMDAHNGVPVYYKRVKKYYAQVGTSTTEGEEEEGGDTPIGPTNPDIPITNTDIPNTNGVEIFEYEMPLEDRTYKYPPRPIHLDKSKAKLRVQKMLNNEGTIVSSQTTTYEEIRPLSSNDIDTDPSDNIITDTHDESNNHPWSFKILAKQERNVNEFLYCYIPGNQQCYGAIRELYDVVRYKEIESYYEVGHSESTTDGLVTTVEYVRDPLTNFTLLKEQKTTNSQGELQRQVYEYPKDRTQELQYLSMINRNQVSIPIIQKTYIDDLVTSIQKSDFIFQNNGYLIKEVKANKGDVPLSDLESKYVINSYDSQGNIREYTPDNGSPISIIWGYDKQYPIAKIENATYANAISGLTTFELTQIHSPSSDAALQLVLNTIRENNPNALVTTYTYKPLIGISSVTDPRGYTMYYQYDAQNRLKLVKDQDGKVYSKNEYHYGINN